MSALLPLPLALGKLLVGPQKRKENNSVGKKKAIETKKEESQDKNKTKKKQRIAYTPHGHTAKTQGRVFACDCPQLYMQHFLL